jgi:acyl-CoA synthetase (AMP-forming)/AMP-acid ligase II
VAAAESGLDAASILAWCNDRLPLPKRPKHVVFVEALPRNDRGKVRRDDLRTDWCRRFNIRASAP